MLAAHRLGARRRAVSDPAALAAAVQRRVWRTDRAGRTARAGALVVRGRGRRRRGDPGGGRWPSATARARAGASRWRPEALVPLPELEGLETAQLDTLLQIAGSSGSPARPALDASTLGEHEDGELEQVFATWEG